MEQPSHKSKFKEIQANLQRSKLEHRELEYEFQKLVLQRNECDRSAMKPFRNKYNSVLEEEKRRIGRNEKIRQMLERIDYKASALAAKTERLKMLKMHYEKNMYRAFSPNSSRDDDSSNMMYTPKYRTKSVDAHTQIPRPNYEVFDMEDDLNSRNCVTSIREPRSVSTSRINQNVYKQPGPDYDQRTIRFNTDMSVNSEMQKPIAESSVNKGVRLFYGHELINLPDLKVNKEQDSNMGEVPNHPEIRVERSQEDRTSKPSLHTNIDYSVYQNPNIRFASKDIQNSENIGVLHNSPNYERNDKSGQPSVISKPSFQYGQNNSISTYQPPLKMAENHAPSPQFCNSNKSQEDLHSNSNLNPQSPYPEYSDNLYSTSLLNIGQANHSQDQDNDNNQSATQSSQNNLYNVNNNNELPIHNPTQIKSGADATYAPNSEIAKQEDLQNQHIKVLPRSETETTLPYKTNEIPESFAQNSTRPQSFQPESTGGLNKIQENHQFTHNDIPDVKPISSNQIKVTQIKPSSPELHTKIIETPSITLPQGIHQVWEKVVDVEIMNPPPKSHSTEPRNDVIDKIYMEISSLGESPVPDDNKNRISSSSENDSRADIIEKIEEHYYGEKIQTNENGTDDYINTNLIDQNYEPQYDPTQIQIDQNIDYTTNAPIYQGSDTINYENPNSNENQEVEYQNYEVNEQQYGSEQDSNLAEHNDNYVTDPVVNYNMEQPMNDPSYNYAQNENYENYTTENGLTEYPVGEQDTQNYGLVENQNYADKFQNQGYQQQPANNEEQYTENATELGSEYLNEGQSVNYDKQNFNPDEYPLQYNENDPETYQDYVIDQQPQIEPTTAYDDYTQNELQANSDPIEQPQLSEKEEMYVMQTPSLPLVEQATIPIIERPKSPNEKLSDTVSKPQIETKKKRVNFLDSSDSEQPSAEEKLLLSNQAIKVTEQSDSDFEFSVKSN